MEMSKGISLDNKTVDECQNNNNNNDNNRKKTIGEIIFYRENRKDTERKEQKFASFLGESKEQHGVCSSFPNNPESEPPLSTRRI